MTTASILDQLAEAESQVATMDANAERAKALAAAARPATRKEVAARAAELRTQVEAARLVALDDLGQATTECYLLTEAADDAFVNYANACLAAFRSRRAIDKARHAVEAAYGLEAAREAYNANMSEANRLALREAQAACNAVLDDPTLRTPATLGQKWSSNAPGVALAYKNHLAHTKLTV
jgi:hypothetical protein